jgi:hypothetical protein
MSTFVLKRKTFSIGSIIGTVGKNAATFLKNNPNLSNSLGKAAEKIGGFAQKNPNLMKAADVATTGAAIYGGLKLGEKLTNKGSSENNNN